MSLLDQVTGAIASKLGGQSNAQNGLMESVLGLISNHSGGLTGLVQAFQRNGLDKIVSSWVSTGQNLPVSPDQIRSALGATQIQDIAQKLGLSEDAASSQLAQLLPNLVDKLTPDGKIPSGDVMSQAMNLLKGKLFG